MCGACSTQFHEKNDMQGFSAESKNFVFAGRAVSGVGGGRRRQHRRRAHFKGSVLVLESAQQTDQGFATDKTDENTDPMFNKKQNKPGQ